MVVIGSEYLDTVLKQQSFSLKMVFNSAGAIFFPAALEHRDQKAPGISYEDDYRGNALAAVLAPGKIEIRHHKGFSDEQVSAVLGRLLSRPELASLRGWRITYQGRVILPPIVGA